ncbi:hypothetical protein [uncultured Aquimarina sp.]|uniref:hypothetical protein n=1 Tax=uncultured Aquimarina sp. TaxID=575652 RepID=UPI002613E9EB|nr:hypothetical protein [uncultured Aquimarina sp.]
MTNQPNKKGGRPLGSGVFALVIGFLFIIATVYISIADFKVSDLKPEELLNAYLIFSGLILMGWGINRVLYNDGRWIIAQNTLNFILAIIATAIAILSILVSK